MKLEEDKRLVLLIMLVFTCMLFVASPSVISQRVVATTHFDDRFIIPEIQDAPVQYDLSIENSGFNSGVSSNYRLSSVLVFPNRITPVNFNHRITIFFATGMNLLMPVPIFIRGHALLN